MSVWRPSSEENPMDPNKTQALVEKEKSIVVPLMIVGGILVVVLLLIGLFMPNVGWHL